MEDDGRLRGGWRKTASEKKGTVGIMDAATVPASFRLLLVVPTAAPLESACILFLRYRSPLASSLLDRVSYDSYPSGAGAYVDTATIDEFRLLAAVTAEVDAECIRSYTVVRVEEAPSITRAVAAIAAAPSVPPSAAAPSTTVADWRKVFSPRVVTIEHWPAAEPSTDVSTSEWGWGRHHASSRCRAVGE